MRGTHWTAFADFLPLLSGLLLVGVSLWSLAARPGPTGTTFLDVVLPLLVGLGFLALSSWFRSLAFDGRQKLDVAGWAALVGSFAVALLLWEQFLLTRSGITVPTAEFGQAALNGLAIGLAAGGAGGYYRVRSKREQATRSDAERSYREIFRKVDDALLVQDFETSVVLEANEKAAELFGRSTDEFVGMTVPAFSATSPEYDMDSAMDHIQAAREGTSQRFDWLIERPDGEEVVVEVTLKAAELSGENRLLAMIRDVSAQRREKENAERLAATRQEFKEVFEQAEVGICLTNPDTREIGRINARFATVLGYEPTEIREMRLTDVMDDHPDHSPERARSIVRDVLDGQPRQVDWPLQRKDGSRVWAEVSIKRATIGGEVRLLVFVRDASERKRRERELEELAAARRDFQEIFEKADVGIALNDHENGTLGRVNQRYADLLGYDRDELRDIPIADVTAADPGFDHEGATALVEAAMAGEPQQFDWLFERKDGTHVWTQVSLKRATIGGDVRLLAFVRDVSERKQRERELRRHSDEMEFFNSLLRHDVLNAITVIRTRGSHLSDSLDGSPAKDAQTIVEWADKVTEVVDGVRDVLETLTGDREQTLQAVDLSTTLLAEIDRLSGTYQGIVVEREVPENVVVEADELLGDVFNNVLTNAVDHNDVEDLRLSVTVDTTSTTARVRIADTGSGIPDERKSEVFRRGNTGHVKKSGSGFGLFFVDSMLTAYDGDVWIEDNEPSGTVVVFEIPTYHE